MASPTTPKMEKIDKVQSTGPFDAPMKVPPPDQPRFSIPLKALPKDAVSWQKGRYTLSFDVELVGSYKNEMPGSDETIGDLTFEVYQAGGVSQKNDPERVSRKGARADANATSY